MSQDPQSRIRTNLRRIRASKGLSPAQVHTRLQDHYGTYAYSSYRNLEASYARNTTKFNQVLVDALAAALDCPRTELASDADYMAIQALPGRRAQRPNTHTGTPQTTEHATALYVHDPETVVERIEAFAKQRGYLDRKTLHRALKFHGNYKITYPTFVAVLNDPTRLRQDMITGFARLFSRPPAKPFDRERLLYCKPLCPHCQDWLIGA